MFRGLGVGGLGFRGLGLKVLGLRVGASGGSALGSSPAPSSKDERLTMKYHGITELCSLNPGPRILKPMF